MRHRRARPLLRAAAIGAALLTTGTTTACGTNRVRGLFSSSAIDLQGTVRLVDHTPTDRAEIQLLLTVNGETRSVPLAPGPWPRRFHVQDADLPGVDLAGTDQVRLLFILIDGGETYSELALVDPHAHGITLELEKGPPGPRAPVYANTKGSRYDPGMPAPDDLP